MIKINNVSFSYDSINGTVLNNINLAINDNEFVGIIGPSGSGKSTLLNVISGLLKPNEGKVMYDDIDIYNLTDKDLSYHINKNIGFIFQDFCLEPRFSVYENIIVPFLINNKITKENKMKIRKRVEELLEIVGIKEKIDDKASNLSGGEKQRVAIARSLMNDPKYIFADEPTGSLDSKNNKNIMELLTKLKEMGHTVILVTHNNDNLQYCNRVISIIDGKVNYE